MGDWSGDQGLKQPPTMWWAYIHQNGGVHMKRYYDPRDLDDARESPFVMQIIQPFEAESHEEALDYLKKAVNGS